MTPDDLVVTRQGIRFRGLNFPYSFGRSGITTHKREGDGATPVGIHHIAGLLYRPDRITAPTPWAEPIRVGSLWSDDPSDRHYNQPIKAPYCGRHEKLFRADPLYDLIILTDWNFPEAVPGLGSAIFIHQWRRPGHPTEGCIAFSRSHLHWIAQNITKKTRLIVSDYP